MLLLSVDWLIGRCRAMTNVTSDLVVAVLLDKLSPETATVEDESIADSPLAIEDDAKVEVEGVRSGGNEAGWEERSSDPDGI